MLLTTTAPWGILLCLAGCGEKSFQVADGWTPPVGITDTKNAEYGGGAFYQWRDTMILLKSHYDRSAKSTSYSFMIRSSDPSNSWTQLPSPSISGGYAFGDVALDPANRRMLLGEGYVENNQLEMRMLFVRVDGGGRVQVESERKWTQDQQSVFGQTGANVRFNLVRPDEKPSRESVHLGPAILVNSEVHVPYIKEFIDIWTCYCAA